MHQQPEQVSEWICKQGRQKSQIGIKDTFTEVLFDMFNVRHSCQLIQIIIRLITGQLQYIYQTLLFKATYNLSQWINNQEEPQCFPHVI